MRRCVLLTALVGGTSNTTFTVISALLNIALGAAVIYWSTSPKHRDRLKSGGALTRAVRVTNITFFAR
ncbi:hypothetical protein AALI21_07725 [Corynebacteriaceae bacterium 6-324]